MAPQFCTTPVPVPPVHTGYRHIATPLPVPESLALLEEMRACEPRSVDCQPPLVWHGAQGVQVYDPYGNIWLDFTSGVLVTNIGHCQPEMVQAARAELDAHRFFSYCFATEPRIRLARRLVDMLQPHIGTACKAFIMSTGSEATENALKLARAHGRSLHPEKNVIVSFDRAFHGRTLGAQQMGGYPAAKSWIGNLDPAFVQVPFPDGLHCTDTSFNLFSRRLAQLGIAPQRVAGVIMESYQGGGASFAPQEYLRELRSFCSRHEALLIMDEVQSGFGRTGRLFAFEHYGIAPDLVCLGKAVSGGLPVSAVAGRADVLDMHDPGSMTSTHGGNPVACASAAANLEVLLRDGLTEAAAATGHILRQGLEGLLQRHAGHIMAIHGRGMVQGIHVGQTEPDGTPCPDGALAFDVTERAFRKGLLLFAPVGTGGATIKICPPLIMQPDAVLEGIDVLTQCFDEALSAGTDR
ncbi:aspartate aminotransferase family protein [Oleidesulfovibrio alaskensis]|jgi:4-aminobutyrate aminotransferase-like enzyme|uniref:aspartate aminotransferase family protein n=1 Tax=Oleidesulfovibrio alaskensis TaxID=58180 RepID=UPI001A4AF345|nr:aspartate aminotransferase family protein [Oleidesulfovibrio alaskensis]MBL3583015.1 aspartate aminotransferase family protein [Oleidesulfovibrio alaskensis]